jgi:hypothetical protein
MTEYQIWMEGYNVTGNSATAKFIGQYEGVDFKGACANAMKDYPLADHYYSPERNSYWGCRLFDNEADARKSFG